MEVMSLDLFSWWAISISSGIVFLTLVSIYLYVVSKAGQRQNKRGKFDERSMELTGYAILAVLSFVFAWVQTLWWFLPGFLFLLFAVMVLVENRRGTSRGVLSRMLAGSIVRNFVFVWVLLGLLVFYIVTIQLGSVELFATGNVIVEALLIVYLMRNRTKKTE